MRLAFIVVPGTLAATPVAAQDYRRDRGYGQMLRAREIAHWRSMDGNYEGANRADHRDAAIARSGW